jgi:alpha-beta hydrolase superfamily lysophospholipase
MEQELPVTRFARSGDVNIAYQVVGEGPFDVVLVPGAFSHVELAWEVPNRAAFARRLASFCRLILFDKRGTGMSDRAGIANLETRMDDVRAVMDATGSQQAVLMGASEGGPMSILFAPPIRTAPERSSSTAPMPISIPGYCPPNRSKHSQPRQRKTGEPAAA